MSDLPPTKTFLVHRHGAGLLAGLAIFVVLMLTPAPEGMPTEAWRAAAVGLLMAVWWVTEALPIAATALLPLVLFPILGIAQAEAAASPYANPLIFLFLGGFLLALAMERWGLHRRVALAIIHAIGTRPTRIIAGFMAACAFLSMWVSNTATALMMLPIGRSVAALAEEKEGGPPTFSIVLMLAIAYSCSIGGMATLIGTPPNALLAGFLRETYGYDLGFMQWMRVGLPITLLGLPLTYLVLTRFVYKVRLTSIPGGRELIDAERATLGPMKPAEWRIALVFAAVAGLWIGRPVLMGAVPGLNDAGIGMAGALLLFALPSGMGDGERVLDWASARRLPWDVLLLFGGGLSLAAAVHGTGLAGWIGDQTGALADWPPVALVGILVTLILLLTELTSNTATAATFLPVVASVALGIGMDPLLLTVPAALAASSAFMLPVATPPNAIVYGSGGLTMPHMARAGVWINLLFIVLLTGLASLLPLLLPPLTLSP